MTDQINIGDKEYVSSKRASELSGYTHDYIGQLARGGQIDAQRVGGLWYVSMEPLLEYKKKTENEKPQPPSRLNTMQQDPGTLIFFDGKEFISANRTSELTGYTQDYVGQLARSGKILSRQVGNRWYVERDAILRHKKEKDALLAAVQAESVGISRSTVEPAEMATPEADSGDSDLHFMYTKDEGDLMPALQESKDNEVFEYNEDSSVSRAHPIPIRVIDSRTATTFEDRDSTIRPNPADSKERISGKTIFLKSFTGLVLTIVIVLGVGFITFRATTALYTLNTRSSGFEESGMGLVAGVAAALEDLSLLLERWLVSEILYRRDTK